MSRRGTDERGAGYSPRANHISPARKELQVRSTNVSVGKSCIHHSPAAGHAQRHQRECSSVYFHETTLHGWRRLIRLIVPENDRSKAVALRLGGRYEKTIPFRGATAEVFAYDLT
jgi:hypothetical protein